MHEITAAQVERRLAFDNPWWTGGSVDEEVRDWPRRDYFQPFGELVFDLSVRRAVVLMGPRRVGKTVMLQQLIHRLLEEGTAPTAIMFASLDTPTYLELSLDELLQIFLDRFQHDRSSRVWVILDEIQYRKDWELYLKSMVDSFPRARFVVSGSAAAALKLKSRESGAGRFTEFVLPPLTFREYLRFTGVAEPTERNLERDAAPATVAALNYALVEYINFGAFPEAALSATVRRDPERYIRNDIIDKVLLRDLPSLYGIEDVQELYRLFSTLAFNSGQELSLEALSQKSGVSKITLKRYLEYLEAAFLIRVLHRVDDRGQRFKRVTAFKVYLTNPAMRAALFGPIGPDEEAMGAMVETAVISQLAHVIDRFERFSYARWKEGRQDREVDLVTTNPQGLVRAASEIKWSDRHVGRPEELVGLIAFAKRNQGIVRVIATTRLRFLEGEVAGVKVLYMPVALFCWSLCEHLTRQRVEATKRLLGLPPEPPPDPSAA